MRYSIQVIRLLLAAFRVTVLILYDDQPVIKWFRHAWCIGRISIREMLSCHRCIGVWTAIAMLLLDKFRLTRWIVNVFALAGAQMLTMWIVKGVDRDIR